MTRHSLAFLIAPCLGLMFAACSGGGGGGGASAPGTNAGDLQLLVGQVPSDQLFAFETTLSSLRLRRTDGALTANLLSGPQTIELQGLDDARRLVAVADVPPGAYDLVRVEFAPASASAKALGGAAVDVTGGGALLAPFDAPVALGAPGQTVAVDLDLAESIQGDATLGAVQFAPVGGSLALGDDKGLIDEVHGVFLEHVAGSQAFRMLAYADNAATVPVGVVTVTPAPNAALFLPNGSLATDAAAFAALLVPGQSWLEVHGLLQSDATILAHRIELEDGPPFAGGGDALVRLQGRVQSVSTGEFELLIQSIKDGASVAQPVLDGLGNPATVTVSWSPATVFKWSDGQGLTTAASLAPGADVKVRFQVFDSEPFPATEIEIEAGGPEHEGRITDVSQLPDRFTMRLFGNQAAIASGAVASSSTDVTVELADAQKVYLKLPQSPLLAKDDLLVDLRVRVRGFVEGDPATPSIDATDVRVRPGRLKDAVVVQVFGGASTFTTSGGDFKDDFGEPVSPGPLTVLVEPDAFTPGHGGVSGLFADLPSAEEVEVKGIGTGVPGQVRAFWVRAKD